MNTAATIISVEMKTGSWQHRLSQIDAPSRGDRYRLRAAQDKPEANAHSAFAELSLIPNWLSWPDEQRSQLAIIAALIAHAGVIERELSGEKLRSLAQKVGSDLFDFIAEHYLEAPQLLTSQQVMPACLPRPEDLETIGQEILFRSLPLSLGSKYPDAANETYARQVNEIAEAAIQSYQQRAALSGVLEE